MSIFNKKLGWKTKFRAAINSFSGSSARSNDRVSLTILNQYFPPDFAATGQLIEELAYHFNEQHINVQVFTGQPSYAFNVDMAPAKELKNNVQIFRTRVSKTRKVIGRTASGLLYCARAFFHLLHPAHRSDVILLTSEPPFLLIIGYLMNLLFGVRFICLIYDLYPDAVVEFGFASSRSPIVQFWNKVNRIVWRRADAIIVLSESMRSRVLINAPEVADKISIIHNWSDPKWIIPIPKQANPFAAKHDLQDKFVVLYSGNMGRCHDLETIIDAAEYLQDDPIRFVFIGAGPKRQEVEESVTQKQLKNCLFLPYQEKSVLPHSLTACDVSLVSVGHGMEGVVAPSKFYSALAAGRPIVAICEKHSYLRQLIADANCGSAVLPGDSRGLAEFIRYLSHDQQRSMTMGQLGNTYIHNRFTRDRICRQYVHLVEEIVLKDTALQRAFRGNEFRFLYHPLYSLSTGQIKGFEQLVYWDHPQRGLLSPSQFIPFADKIGVLVEMGQKWIETALQDLKTFQSNWDFPLTLKINLSQNQFYDPCLVPFLDRCLEEYEIPRGSLCLDISEEILTSDCAAATAILLQLRDREIEVCLENFGEGATSVKFLNRFPFNSIELDRKVIQRLDFDPEADTLIEFINLIAKGKGIDVIADGIESEPQLTRVKALGVSLGKGHVLNKPISKSQILETVLSRNISILNDAIQWSETTVEQCLLAMPLVLINTDEPAMEHLLRLMLKKDQLNCIEASDSETSLEMLRKYDPALLLLDDKMMDLDCYEFCQRIRELEQRLGKDQTPILIVTQMNHPEQIQTFSNLGAIDFIAYPVNWEMFRQQIHRLLTVPQSEPDQPVMIQTG